jgi:hypothetical protein
VLRRIALIGDVMNTAASFQHARRGAGCRAPASATLLERVGALSIGVTSRSLDPLPTRGS